MEKINSADHQQMLQNFVGLNQFLWSFEKDSIQFSPDYGLLVTENVNSESSGKLTKGLQNCKNLTEFGLSLFGINSTDSEIEQIFNALGELQALQKLFLRLEFYNGKRLTSSGINSLALALQKAVNIQELELEMKFSSLIEPDSIAAVFQSIPQNVSRLRFTANRCDDSFCQNIPKFFESHPKLENVFLSIDGDDKLTQEGYFQFWNALSIPKQLKSVGVGFNKGMQRFNKNCAKGLAKSISSLPNLQELEIAYKAGNDVISGVITELTGIKGLKSFKAHFWFGSVHGGDFDEFFTPFIANNPALEALDLRLDFENPDKYFLPNLLVRSVMYGLKKLWKQLKTYKGLLHIQSNNLTIDTFINYFNAIKTQTAIENLDLNLIADKNTALIIRDDKLQSVGALLAQIKPLKKLNLKIDCEFISKDGMANFFGGLSKNGHDFTHIDIEIDWKSCKSRIDSAIGDFAKMLENSTKLKVFRFVNSAKLGEVAKSTIQNMLKNLGKCQEIERIHIDFKGTCRTENSNFSGISKYFSEAPRLKEIFIGFPEFFDGTNDIDLDKFFDELSRLEVPRTTLKMQEAIFGLCSKHAVMQNIEKLVKAQKDRKNVFKFQAFILKPALDGTDIQQLEKNVRETVEREGGRLVVNLM